MSDLAARVELLKQALPQGMRDAEVDETPCGSLIMEWFKGWRLAIYLTNSGRIGFAHYAGATNRSHGEFPCVLPSLPIEIQSVVNGWQPRC